MAQQQKLLTELDENTFTDSIATGVTLVDFWAPWCSPCLIQTPILEGIAHTFLDRATIAKVNVDDFPALATKFNVQGIPTLIIFKDGKVAKRMVGVQSQQDLVNGIEEIL